VSSKIKIKPILSAFSGDREIENFCDPNSHDKTGSGVAVDTFNKLRAWDELSDDGVFTEVFNGGNVVGFIYTVPGRLVSFGVSPNHRVKPVLKKVFEDIVEMAGDEFLCAMWTRNSRGVQWLQRCGMEILTCDDVVTELIYKKCQ